MQQKCQSQLQIFLWKGKILPTPNVFAVSEAEASLSISRKCTRWSKNHTVFPWTYYPSQISFPSASCPTFLEIWMNIPREQGFPKNEEGDQLLTLLFEVSYGLKKTTQSHQLQGCHFFPSHQARIAASTPFSASLQLLSFFCAQGTPRNVNLSEKWDRGAGWDGGLNIDTAGHSSTAVLERENPHPLLTQASTEEKRGEVGGGKREREGSGCIRFSFFGISAGLN